MHMLAICWTFTLALATIFVGHITCLLAAGSDVLNRIANCSLAFKLVSVLAFALLSARGGGGGGSATAPASPTPVIAPAAATGFSAAGFPNNGTYQYLLAAVERLASLMSL